MSTDSYEALKAELISTNAEFRELAREHRRCEDRISELISLPYPNQNEVEETHFLKKKKLSLKDRMEEIIQVRRKAHAGH